MGILPPPYNIEVVLKKERNKRQITVMDKGKIINDKNLGTCLKLRKSKAKIKVPKFDTFDINQKGKTVLTLWSPGPNKYYQVRWDGDKMKPEGDDLSMFVIDNVKKLTERFRKKQSFFEIYGPLVMMSIFIMGVVVLFIFGAQYQAEVSKGMGGLVDTIAQASNTLSQTIGQLQGTGIRPPT